MSRAAADCGPKDRRWQRALGDLPLLGWVPDEKEEGGKGNGPSSPPGAQEEGEPLEPSSQEEKAG